MKSCPRCRVSKPDTADNYYIRPDGRRTHSWCKDCTKSYAKEKAPLRIIYNREYKKRPDVKASENKKARIKYATNPDFRAKAREKNLRRNFGLSLDDFNSMLDAQGGVCAVCMSSNPGGYGTFHVDHDHATGEIRGLLCHGCNTGIGNFHENPDFMRAAIDYLSSTKSRKLSGV